MRCTTCEARNIRSATFNKSQLPQYYEPSLQSRIWENGLQSYRSSIRHASHLAVGVTDMP